MYKFSLEPTRKTSKGGKDAGSSAFGHAVEAVNDYFELRPCLYPF